MSTSMLWTNEQKNGDLCFLTPHQIAMIDEALASIGEFGEVRLVVEKGRLRFVLAQHSVDALKWQPGSFQRQA